MATDGHDLLRERLLDRELQLRTAQEMAEFGIWEWDIPADTVVWSEQLHEIYGTDPDTYTPTYEGYLSKLHPRDRNRVAGAIQRAFGDHQPFSFDERIVRPDGEVRTLHSRGRVVTAGGEPVRMIGVCQDVTPQRAALATLRETAGRLEEAQAIAKIGSWEWDMVKDVVTWSPEMYRIYGADPETFGASYTALLERVHPDDREDVEIAIRHAFTTGGEFSFNHRIVRPDGTVAHLEARGKTVPGPDGHPIRLVGTGRDVTEQRAAEEKAASAAAAIEMARRLASLQRITEAALAHLSLEDLLPTMLERISEALAIDNAALLLMEPDGETLTLRAARGIGAGELDYSLTLGEGFAGRVALERKLLVVEEQAHEYVTSPALKEARLQSMLGVPLLAGDRVVGVLHVGSTEHRSFGADEIAMVELAAERAALGIEHARVFDRERGIAETLQRALLPATLPDLGPMSAAVRYVPAAEGTEVGGDWYDVIPLADGHVGVAMGDVTGHGLEAAALMAQLRHGLRAYALETLDPATVAERLDRLIHSPGLERLATLLYAVIAPDLSIQFVNAGHLPPLVVRATGEVDFLESTGGLPIGCDTTPYPTDRVHLEPGDVLVLYTDGLIERRGESISDGLDRLRAAAGEGPDDPERLADHLIEALLHGRGTEDDVALLAIRPTAVPAKRAV